MKKSFLLALALVLIALPALGQMPFMRMPQMKGEFKMPAVGSWSDYRIIRPDINDTVLVKLSLTGKEKCDTMDCYWFEFQSGENGRITIVKMLVSGDPNERDNLKRIIVKNGESPAIEFPLAMMRLPMSPPPPRPEGEEAGRPELEEEPAAKGPEMTKVGTETLDLPAGKLKCTHMKAKEGERETDVWLNETIPFFGIAKSSDGRSVFELTGFGATGAKTAITEEPEKIPGPGEHGPEKPNKPEGQ